MTGFVQWQQRREDRRERQVERLSDAIIDVQTHGIAWMRDAELLLNVFIDAPAENAEDFIENHPRFEAYTLSGVRFQSSITRARLLIDGELYTALDNLSAAFRDLGLSAFMAVAADADYSQADVAAAATQGKKKLYETHMLFNEFLRVAVKQLRQAREH